MGRESNFQASVLKYLNSLPGCVAENVSGNSQQSGRPDVNGCIRGRMFKLELKTKDNEYKASKKQELNLRRWRRSGSIVGVVYSLDFLREVFSQRGFHKRVAFYEKDEENDCYSWIDVPEV